MNCALCKGDMEKKLVAHTVDLGKCIIIVRNAPAMVCSQCGKVRYTGTVVEQLEVIVDMIAATAITELAVVNYSDQVA